MKSCVLVLVLCALSACAGSPGDGPVTEQDAEQLANLRDNADALRAFNRLLAAHPGDPRTLAHRGEIYENTGRPDLALTDLDTAIRADGGTPYSVALRALAKQHLGQIKGAMDDAQRALSLLEAGIDKKHSDPAFAALDSIDRDFAFTAAHTLRAEINKEKGRFAPALADVDAILQSDPTYTSGWLVRGSIERATGDFAAALADDVQAARLNDHEDTVLSLCSDYVAALDMDVAVRQCSAAITVFPKRNWGYDERGAAYLKIGNWAKALADYNVAVTLTPHDAEALYGRSLARFRLGDLEGSNADREAAERIERKIEHWFVLRGISVPRLPQT